MVAGSVVAVLGAAMVAGGAALILTTRPPPPGTPEFFTPRDSGLPLIILGNVGLIIGVPLIAYGGSPSPNPSAWHTSGTPPKVSTGSLGVSIGF